VNSRPRPLSLMLQRLDRAHRAGGQWLAACPSHADHRPSLAIRERDDGSLLVRCYAACLTSDVLSAMGLSFADLYPRA
jgi:hypothetical protein